jgi:peptide/nickel transport system substrate-binding protein
MRRRRFGAPLALLIALCLAACAPGLPDTVVPGTEVTVGWTGAFTSANAAASPTSGNTAIAETIRGGFGDVMDGEFVADESFGVVTIVAEDPFTVRYDLAEPAWSDGIPLDAADLLLGWAAASGYFSPVGESEAGAAEADAGGAEADAEPTVPAVDEFARAIDVTFERPVFGWQQAVAVPVAAHIVGRHAFGIDDAMEAKQAVIRAIQDDDRSALDEMSEVWNAGFEISGGDEIGADLLLSSGPFLVDEVRGEEEGRSVTLVPNPSFRGSVTPKVSRIDLVPPGDQPIADVGGRLDVAILAPTTADRGPLRELERKDFTVNTSQDGTAWALLLNPAGIFTSQPARVAFLRAAPAAAMVQRGSGLWSSAYTGTTSMVSAPGSRAYDIVNEDSGFAVALGTPSDDPAREREAAGVDDASAVCVLYDRASEFAAGAFAALRDSAAEAGWLIVDCSSDDFEAARTQRGWDAVIARTPIPQTPEQIAAQWGSGGTASLTGNADVARDELIAQYAQTTDVYEAREVLAQIEATIVQAAVALPLAVNPLVTVTDRGVTGVATPGGDAARLIVGAAQWEITP